MIVYDHWLFDDDDDDDDDDEDDEDDDDDDDDASLFEQSMVIHNHYDTLCN